MTVKRLGDVCNVRRGTTITKTQTIDEGIPVIGGGTKPTYFHDKSNREANCITISGSGASAGYVNFWTQPIFASDCSTVEPRDNQSDVRFIYYFLQSKQQYIYDKFRSGAAQPHVYAKDIATIEYPVLPLPVQKAIVAKLDAAFASIDTAIAAAEENAENAKQLFQSYLSDVFEKGGEGWVETTLGDAFNVRDGTHDSPKFVKDGYPLVTSKNLKNGILSLEKIQYISADDYKKINERSNVHKFDVLFAMIGTIGNPVVVEKNPNFAIKNVALFKNPKNNNSYFLRYYLMSDMVLNKMSRDAKGATQKFVSLGYLLIGPHWVVRVEC